MYVYDWGLIFLVYISTCTFRGIFVSEDVSFKIECNINDLQVEKYWYLQKWK